jgi:hypothetical protein
VVVGIIGAGALSTKRALRAAQTWLARCAAVAGLPKIRHIARILWADAMWLSMVDAASAVYRRVVALKPWRSLAYLRLVI